MLATGPGRPLYGILAFILLFAPLISAHIRLVFPPARQPALDSYSTSNAEPPCGVPKPPQGQGVHTFLQAGSEVDVEWINAIPHMGGIRIEVLNALDQPIAIFTNFIDPYNISHPTKKISLPKQFECQNCALRLSHQATEYGTEYQFFSCADVNIVNTIPDGDSCSGNGQRMNGECECDDKFTGNYCHIENECAQETDCGTHGVCRSTLDQPRGQCFCQKGYFGKTCDKVSRGPNNPNDFDPTLYNLRQADDNKIYWRILEDEIEFVLKFPGKSWAGIGWKPQDFVCPTIIPQPPLHQQKEVTYPQKSAIEKETILKKVDSAPNAKLPTAENADSKASHRPLPASVTFVQKAPKSEKVTEDDEEDKSDDFSVDAESTEYGGEETELPFKVTPDMMSAEHSTVPTTVAKTTVATKATAVTIAQEEESEEAEVVEDTKKPKSDLETTTATKATTKAKLQVEIGVSDPDLAEEDEKSGNTCGENEEFNKCPEMSRECEASCDWTRFPETIPNCPRQCGEARCVCKAGFVRQSNDENKCVPFDFCSAEEEPQCSANATYAKCGTACEPSCENMYDTSPCPASCETPACTCSDNYVRYKGGCIYWGDCPNLEDHLAFDEAQPTAKSEAASAAVTLKTTTTEAPKTESFGKTTPLLKPAQTVCPVNETMTECGQVCEANCVTIFTRTACDKCGDPECACIQGYARSNGVCVYWGDCPRQTQKSTPRFPKTTTIIPAKQAEQKEPKKFVSDDLSTDNEKCYGDWRYPDGCKDCDYKLSWNYVDESDEIEFSLETKAPQNWWTGVGFSPQGSMADADMIIIKSFNGKLSLLDMYSASYSVPTLDASQDAYSETVIGTHANGVLRAQFTRKRNTGDTKGDHIFSDTQCHNFLFPVEGGKLDENGNITIHTATPFVSGDKICVSSCISEEEEKPAKVTDTCETEYRYPPSCVESACDYIARWNYDAQRQDVKFEISSKDLGRWTGIGFSRDGKMANADIYTGWVYEGKAYVTDRYAYGRQLPAIDPADRSDIYEVEGKLFEEMQTISFRRKVVPKDTITDLPLDQCYYFLFPVGGGRVLARKSQDFSNPRTPIGFHDQETPKVSKTKICLCRDGKPLKSSEPHQVRVRRQALQQQQQQQQQSTVSAMACTDMVVGSVFDGRGRVRDMYSPSKASPRMDSFFAGEDDLSGAAAYSEDGVTTIVFRKKLNSNDPADHPILPGPMTVIWAKGADSERYQHTTGGEPIKADPAFFGTDLFKYHGKNRRGVLTIDFFEDSKSSVSKTTVTQAETSTSIRPLPNIPDAPTNEPDGFPSCSGRFSYPRGCEKLDCPYVVEWSSDGVEITFHLEAKVEDRKWTAVGFSRDGGMANSDVVVVSVERGEISVVDQFMPNYGRPAIDEQQDVYDIETAYKSGRVSANFSRRLATKDMNDVSLDECQFFLFTPTGGDLDGNGEILKHQDTPTSSQTKICLSMCNRHTTLSTLAVPVQTKPSPTTQKPKTTTESNDESMEYEDEDESEEKTTQRTTQKVPSTIPGKRLETTRKPAKTLPPIVTQMEDATKRYSLRVRILNREWSPALADPQSEHYRSFTKEVSEAINNLLAKKWQGMRVSKIVDYTKGSVIAEFEVDSNGSPPPMVRELAIYLEGAALRGEIEGFSVEPTTVKVKEMIIPEKPKEEKPMNESIDNLLQGISVDPELLRNVIVISIAALVLLLAVICCCCIMCRIRKTRNNFSPMRSSDSMEAKSYSDIPYKADSYPLPYPASYGPYGTLQPKHPKSQMMNGFENKAFQGPNGTHQRHFSQATTASNKGESSSPAPSGNGHEGMPDGMGETTYHEWYNKVASRPAAQHHEEAMPQLTAPPGAQPNRPPSTQPYVSYPNDPSAFYTLGGEHRQRRNPL